MVEIVQIGEQHLPHKVMVCTEPPHMGMIEVHHRDMQDLLDFDQCDTQGRLRDEGVFDRIHERLDLPASFVIRAIFHQVLYPKWSIYVEHEAIPLANEYEDYPRLHLRYWKGEGMDRPKLTTIDVERYQRVYPLSNYLAFV